MHLSIKRIGLLICLLVAITLGGSYAWYADAINIPRLNFAETRALVQPHMQTFLPATDQPRPAVLLFHGCGGLKPSLVKRAEDLAGQGYVAVIVDSYTGRNIEWQRVCDGRELFGDQRAADVLVALEFARTHAAIDAAQLFLIGYSHGGWTVLESLAYGGDLPRGLTDSPGNQFAGVRGLIAWYPYCGFGTRFRGGWQAEIPVLMLLAAEDEMTDPAPCVTIAEQQAEKGRPVDWQMYDNVSHGFDTDEDWVVLYDADTHQRARAAQLAFLRAHSH